MAAPYSWPAVNGLWKRFCKVDCGKKSAEGQKGQFWTHAAIEFKGIAGSGAALLGAVQEIQIQSSRKLGKIKRLAAGLHEKEQDQKLAADSPAAAGRRG